MLEVEEVFSNCLMIDNLVEDVADRFQFLKASQDTLTVSQFYLQTHIEIYHQLIFFN